MSLYTNMRCNLLYICVTVYKYTFHVCHCCTYIQVYNTRACVCRCASFLLLYFFNMVTFTFGQGDQTGRRDLIMMMIGWDIIIQSLYHNTLAIMLLLFSTNEIGNHHTLMLLLFSHCLHLQNQNLFSCRVILH